MTTLTVPGKASVRQDDYSNRPWEG
jgi:hypothetical protein